MSADDDRPTLTPGDPPPDSTRPLPVSYDPAADERTRVAQAIEDWGDDVANDDPAAAETARLLARMVRAFTAEKTRFGWTP